MNSHLTRLSAVRGYVPNLDGLRALSILLVALSHLLPINLPGAYGVLLFFNISGFLICRLLFAELKESDSKSISIRNFYVRRLFRLYPAVLVYCIIVVSIQFYRAGTVDLVEPMSALFYYANYLVSFRTVSGVGYQMPFKVFWSLSVEEHFYIAFPFIFQAFGTNPSKLFAFVFGLSLCSVIFRFLAVCFLSASLADSHLVIMQTQFRLDSIGFGVMLACACEISCLERFLLEVMTSYWSLALAGVSLLLALFSPDMVQVVVREPLMSMSFVIGIATLVFTSRLSFISELLCSNVIVYLGRISYSLYLWHIPCGLVVASLFGRGFFVGFLALFVSIAVASLSYFLIEYPFIKFGRAYLASLRSIVT